MSRIKLLIVDDVDETRESIKRLLQFETSIKVVGEAGSGKEAARQAEVLRPDVILMDINMPEQDGLSAAEEISTRFPHTNIIMISVQGETEYIKRAMLAGAREFLVKPFTGEELINAIHHAHRLEKLRLESSPHTPPPAPAFDPQVITVFGTKGGVGKTTVAVNLAVSLQQLYKTKAALIDLDLQFGDVGVMLNLSSRRSLIDLAMAGGDITPESLEEYLSVHNGISVLAAPLKPEYAELITPGQVEKIIKALSQTYEYVVIDTAASFNEVTLTALDRANQILLVGAQDLPTVKNLRLSLEVLEALHHLSKTRLILNRQNPELGIRTEDLERALGIEVINEIPNDVKAVSSSVNRGIPLMETAPQSKPALALRRLAGLVHDYQKSLDGNPFPAKRGLLSRLVGR
ncbi:MAG: response regulator [Firmicutes bacterium]|nr:response regulator [Bacillota bacterium]